MTSGVKVSMLLFAWDIVVIRDGSAVISRQATVESAADYLKAGYISWQGQAGDESANRLQSMTYSILPQVKCVEMPVFSVPVAHATR